MLLPRIMQQRLSSSMTLSTTATAFTRATLLRSSQQYEHYIQSGYAGNGEGFRRQGQSRRLRRHRRSPPGRRLPRQCLQCCAAGGLQGVGGVYGRVYESKQIEVLSICVAINISFRSEKIFPCP